MLSLPAALCLQQDLRRVLQVGQVGQPRLQRHGQEQGLLGLLLGQEGQEGEEDDLLQHIGKKDVGWI